MVFEVRRPRGRPQIQKKCAPTPIQKTSLKIMRFSAILGPKMEPKWVQNRIQNRWKNRSENREARVFKAEVPGGPRKWVGGSGVDPGRRGRGGGKPPPEYRWEDPAINAVNARGLIRPVPRGYGGFSTLRAFRRALEISLGATFISSRLFPRTPQRVRSLAWKKCFMNCCSHRRYCRCCRCCCCSCSCSCSQSCS